VKQRDGRGLQNTITGRLLCPIAVSWDDEEYAVINAAGHVIIYSFCSVCRTIQTAELDISEDYFLTCLYSRGIGNSDDVEHGFLRSGLLVRVCIFSTLKLRLLTDSQTFCAIFTSPSSSEAFDGQESEEGPHRKIPKTASQKKATKMNIATLLHMDGKVTPRAIAYAATLVCSFGFAVDGHWITST
jgi:hypothetical protein